MTVINITKDNYEKEILRQNRKIVVDFWAEWCGPCKVLGPIFEEISKDYNEDVIFAKVNVDKERDIAAKYNIMSIPTIIIFDNGKEKEKLMGFRPKEALVEDINRILK